MAQAHRPKVSTSIRSIQAHTFYTIPIIAIETRPVTYSAKRGENREKKTTNFILIVQNWRRNKEQFSRSNHKSTWKLAERGCACSETKTAQQSNRRAPFLISSSSLPSEDIDFFYQTLNFWTKSKITSIKRRRKGIDGGSRWCLDKKYAFLTGKN